MKHARLVHLALSVLLVMTVFGAGVLAMSQSPREVIKRQPAAAETELARQIFEETIAQNPNRYIETTVLEVAQNEPSPNPAVVRETRQANKLVAQGDEYDIYMYEPSALPNDPNANQWWVDDIGMEQAWTIGPGVNSTVVAVIDTGFELNHEELSNRWYNNSGEKGYTPFENPSDLNCTDQGLPLNASCNNIDDNFDGIMDNESGPTTLENPSRLNCTDQSIPKDKSCNLRDDDGNGFIDDWRGWDFANYDAFVAAGETNPAGSETKHGTMVSGVVGATGNNGVGIAGMNWTTKILPIQVFDDDGYADTVIVSRAIRYAAEMGADVINLSLGTLFYDSYLRDAVADAITAGSIVVAAAGNDGCNCISYPANFPEVVAVGAIDSTGSRAYYSSYGNNLDLVAPGSGLMVPTWSSSSDTAYAYASGTSFSSPLVAGLLSLARSHQPQATWAELSAALMENTDRAKLGGSAFSTSYGFGLADAGALLGRVTQPMSYTQVEKFSSLNDQTELDSQNAYQCKTGQAGATTLWELKKNGRYHYTVSQYDKEVLKSQYWTSKSLGYVCLLLPTDTTQDVRLINPVAEFANQNPKLVD